MTANSVTCDVDCHVRVRDGQVSGMNHLREYFRRLLKWVATEPDPQYSPLDGRDGLRIGDLVEEQEEANEEVDTERLSRLSWNLRWRSSARDLL